MRTVGDLLEVLPKDYLRSDAASVGEVDRAGEWSVAGRLEKLRIVRPRGRRRGMLYGELVDAAGRLSVLWFQPYLIKRLTAGETYVLSGTVRAQGSGWRMTQPAWRLQADLSTAPEPLYPSLGGLGPAQLGTTIRSALDRLELGELPDWLPLERRDAHGLPSLGEALRRLHLPASQGDLEAAEGAWQRLIYGELLEHQLLCQIRRRQARGTAKAHPLVVDEASRRRLRALAPFVLTAAQERVMDEILADLARGWPMRRLLHGDVGCGKTVVAAMALAAVLEAGQQGVYMAPTELLAQQQYQALTELLGERFTLGLASRSASHREAVERRLETGEIDLVIGTHALLEERMRFDRLGLIVIDEQHRFGVGQRRRLLAKGDAPDLLVMTATPIPRTLSQVLYGDLDVSVIDEMPPGRSAVATQVVPQSRRPEVYGEVTRRLQAGQRGFVVLPLVAGSRHLDAAAVEGFGETIRESLGGFPSAIVHGRLSAAERGAALAAFAAGEVRLLVATTVVEVGIDVPQATFVVIESAERFGLAQLHQLRGRVGRGSEGGLAIAVHGKLSETAARRLEAFATQTDGFRLAELDLEIRGPGDLLGQRQAGRPAFRTVELPRDSEWLRRANRDAPPLLRELAAGRHRRLALRLEGRLNEA